MTTALDHNIDGIACKELIGSGSGEFTFDSSRMTRIFRCAWGDRVDLAQALMGETTVDEDGNTVQLSPKAHPDVATLYCRRVQFEPFSADSKTIAVTGTDLDTTSITYDFAKVTATYEPFVTEFSPGDQLITQEFDVGTDTIELPGAGFKWSDDNKIVSQKVFVQFGMVEDSIVFHRSASSKRAVMKALAGTVNNAAFADSPKGSLLFLGGRGRRSVLVNSVEQWELAFRFRHRHLGAGLEQDTWQKLYKPNVGWTSIYRIDATSQGPYREGNFNQLIS